MGLNLDALSAKTATVTVDFMGQSAKITYDPTYLTAETIAIANRADDAKFVEFFTGLVKDWDVTRGKKKVPITDAGLQGVPLLFLRSIFMQVMRDGGEEEQGKASNAG